MKKEKCSSNGKTIFLTQVDANNAISSIKSHNSFSSNNFKSGKRNTGKPTVKRSYYCVYCKGFHITSIADINLVDKKQYERNKSAKEYLNSINVTAWKLDSIPFEQGHIPPPKNKKVK